MSGLVEKSPHISGPVQCTPKLFKGQLYRRNALQPHCALWPSCLIGTLDKTALWDCIVESASLEAGNPTFVMKPNLE